MFSGNQKRKVARVLALTFVINLLLEAAAPITALALTSGPGNPEFSSFEPVATTDMVNLLSGDFTYNLPVIEVPGPAGSGYAMSLSYHSGVTSEEEASWVGFGWSLNPGAINRNTRGFPDDYDNATVVQYNKARPNWSASTTAALGMEVLSADLPMSGTGVTVRETVRYNNYAGLSATTGFDLRSKGLSNLGIGSLSVNTGAEGTTYAANISVAGLLQRGAKKQEKKQTAEEEFKGRKDFKLMGPRLSAPGLQVSHSSGGGRSGMGASVPSTYGIFSFSDATRQVGVVRYEGASYNYTISTVFSMGFMGLQTGFDANFSIQRNTPTTTYTAHGYMNTPGFDEDQMEERLTDYYVERNSPYNKRDLFLGIPFNNADNFALSGEGVGGGFRYYPQKVGFFYPDYAENRTRVVQGGVDFSVGAEIGVGVELGMGSQKFKVENWKNRGNTYKNQFSSSSGGVFRFNNDLGGQISYDTTAKLRKAALGAESAVPGFKQIYPSLADDFTGTINSSSEAPKSSSSIRFHTLADLANGKFNKSANQTQISQLGALGIPAKSITELSIVNEEGQNYVYGLPVTSKNETNLQVNVDESQSADRYTSYAPLHLTSSNGQYHVPAINGFNEHKSLIGEIRKTPYANSFLLTQLTTPDYLDVNNNGPDKGDFGGWTQFHYYQKYGAGQDWYAWRTPYTGLSYDAGQISDKKDDLGSVSCGQKQVYYLKVVETKTHLALFVTNMANKERFKAGITDTSVISKIPAHYLKGSQIPRADGLSALAPSSIDSAANNAGKRGNQTLETLEKIVLFSKSRPDKPIKTVCFKYNNSLVQELPNNINGTGAQSGKLTLTHVWFEYEGISNIKASPYQFTYNYKTQIEYPKNVWQQYSSMLDNSNLNLGNAQNPTYKPHNLDTWGNPQVYGDRRKKNLIPWAYQGPLPASYVPSLTNWAPNTANAPKFDPACWQLKQIKLPSGGEILIEYEQKDYAYVQDRKPMAMARLLAASEMNDKKYSKTPSYDIDVRDLGLNPDSAHFNQDVTEQLALINEHFEEQKIYFKFLYALNDKAGAAGLNNCLSEYITGYAEFDTARVSPVDPTRIQIQLKGNETGSEGYTHVPRQACFDYYVTQRLGKTAGNCDDMFSYRDHQVTANNNGAAEALLGGTGDRKLGQKLDIIIPTLIDLTAEMPKMLNAQKLEPGSVGSNINLGLSFLKLPMLKPKKGGGVRVKRLLMLDNGLESKDGALYGQEYLYQDFEQVGTKMRAISSGVATNEPTGAREENPLVTFLPRKSQGWYSRITAGEDKEQTEGPIGESLLPAASVAHSRVVVRNIHSGATGTGFTVHEYNTVKDYPFDRIYEGGNGFEIADNSQGVEYSDLADGRQRDFMMIPAGIFVYELNKEYLSQGYRFIINQMHGQPKRVASYAGDYQFEDYWLHNTEYELSSISALPKVTEQSYEYYEPGEKVKLMKPNGNYALEVPGKEMDVAMEMKAANEVTMDLNIEVDIAIMAPLIPKISAALSFQYYNRGLSTCVMSKVLRYPVLLKKTSSFRDGITSTNENLAFNPLTGKPVLTRTYDSYHGITKGNSSHDGSVYTLDLPAAWYYSDLGQKAGNAANTNQLNLTSGQVTSYGAGANPLRDRVYSFKDTANEGGWYAKKLTNILSARMQTMSNSYFGSSDLTATLIASEYGISSANVPYLNSLRKPKASYQYRDNITSGKAHSAGTFSNSFAMFSPNNWGNNSIGESWLKTEEITRYSPQGEPVEQKDALGIYSSARFNPLHNQPVIIGKNAQYGELCFEDFEAHNKAIAGIAHSGARSLKLDPDSIGTVSIKLASGNQLFKKGGILKAWVKSSAQDQLKASFRNDFQDIQLSRVAGSGEWSLYQAVVPQNKLPASGQLMSLSIQNKQAGAIYLDDVKFQPLESQTTCYVYDRASLRLLATFDDQHFGLFYQYNDEGKLVRKLVETERGVFTIQETQYNTPKRGL